jgi:hypothetical protein
MAAGGVIELIFGINAEGKSLEDVTKPLTSVTATDGSQAPAVPAAGVPA